MKYKLKKLPTLSGNKTTVYSVIINDEEATLFEKFLEENKSLYLSEIKNILKRLESIGKIYGARYHYFKENEGLPGDGVCALYDDNPKAKLRLYCIRFESQLIIIGGGSPKNVRTLQEDPKLKAENFLLRKLSQQIKERLNSEIYFINNGLDFKGNLEFENDEE